MLLGMDFGEIVSPSWCSSIVGVVGDAVGLRSPATGTLSGVLPSWPGDGSDTTKFGSTLQGLQSGSGERAPSFLAEAASDTFLDALKACKRGFVGGGCAALVGCFGFLLRGLALLPALVSVTGFGLPKGSLLCFASGKGFLPEDSSCGGGGGGGGLARGVGIAWRSSADVGLPSSRTSNLAGGDESLSRSCSLDTK